MSLGLMSLQPMAKANGNSDQTTNIKEKVGGLPVPYPSQALYRFYVLFFGVRVVIYR
jgi:hypothetical protein